MTLPSWSQFCYGLVGSLLRSGAPVQSSICATTQRCSPGLRWVFPPQKDPIKKNSLQVYPEG
ncbi:hypothetical protein I79_006407 [Cricetulus griseus]|uniref:Uncharacterized protein n=1 Tax=Cricetulus griseus TaxID=10029 RepID=G3H7R9_CRIGR|nr:hypothetical protein I79_006407 [Cricetulus griseus]